MYTAVLKGVQLLLPIKITGKKPINIILNFLTWSLYGPKPVTADFGLLWKNYLNARNLNPNPDNLNFFWQIIWTFIKSKILIMGYYFVPKKCR